MWVGGEGGGGRGEGDSCSRRCSSDLEIDRDGNDVARRT